MDLQEENDLLKKQLAELAEQSKQDRIEFEQQVAKARGVGKVSTDAAKQKDEELASMRNHLGRLTRQLNDEMGRRDEIVAETRLLERRLQELGAGGGSPPATASSQRLPKEEDNDSKNAALAKASTKLMRVIDQWMNTRDLQQALLRGAGVNDMAFITVVNVVADCKSLQVLDLGQNQITMDSCSDVCRLITTAPSLSFISIAENLFSLRSVGYFMTAIMERQNKKKLVPLEVLDMQGNEGLVQAMGGAPPDDLVRMVRNSLGTRLPPRGDVLLAMVMRELWRFLHYTEHPQLVNAKQDEVDFKVLDKMTVRKMESALTKILLFAEEGDAMSTKTGGEPGGLRSIHAHMALTCATDDREDIVAAASPPQSAPQQSQARPLSGSVSESKLPPLDPKAGRGGGGYAAASNDAGRSRSAAAARTPETTQKPPKTELRDPFADLKAAFEPPKEKLKTFNLKRIVTPGGTVLMAMLERLLETTEIDARDVETDQTLLEYAATTGNMPLAKLCYRRKANLSALTKKGYTYLNIVTKARRYDLMEFFHQYGVKINHQDAKGTTALHLAAANNDEDAMCRLIEWGADVNIMDFGGRSPLMTAARKGNMKAAMLLLELGADLNAKDAKEYTAVAHAEAKNQFAVMDRLVLLGGKGHGLQSKEGDSVLKSKSGKQLGQVTVTASMLKSSSLGRIGKVAVDGLPGQLRPTLLK